jgi:phosphopantetheinyl transferase
MDQPVIGSYGLPGRFQHRWISFSISRSKRPVLTTVDE